MNATDTGFATEARVDYDDLATFGAEISDEALEAAACAGPQHGLVYTIAMCTGLQECPF